MASVCCSVPRLLQQRTPAARRSLPPLGYDVIRAGLTPPALPGVRFTLSLCRPPLPPASAQSPRHMWRENTQTMDHWRRRTHTDAHTQMHTHRCTHTCTSTLSLSVLTHTCVRTCIQTRTRTHAHTHFRTHTLTSIYKQNKTFPDQQCPRPGKKTEIKRRARPLNPESADS